MPRPKNNWTDASVEGKILRKIFKKLSYLFNETDNINDKARLSHAMLQVAIAKNNLVKTNDMQQDIEKIKEKLGLT